MIADGLVNEVHGSKGPFTEGIDLTAWDSMAAHNRGLQKLVELWRKSRKKTTTEPLTLPFRHGIIHGRDLGYDNRLVAAKLWAFLFALREWARAAQDGRLEEPPSEPRPTLTETLKRYRIGQEERAKLEQWQPRSSEELALISPVGTPDDYDLNSPERIVVELMALWARSNYGDMVQHLHLPLEAPLDKHKINKIAKELRQLFQGKDMLSFRLIEICDRAPAFSSIKVAVDYRQDGQHTSKQLELGAVYMDEEGPACRGKMGGRWLIQNLWSL